MKICDFGTGKVLETGGSFSFRLVNPFAFLTGRLVDRAQTWVGTAQYIAPELLEAKETSKRFVISLK
jgi:3-phosphoinositide dependent protein kinase-1